MGCALLGARQERRKAWRRKQKQNRRGSDSSAISHARASVSEGQGRRARTRTWTRTSASFKTSPRSFPPPARLRTRPQLQPRCASARPTQVDDVTTPFPPAPRHLSPLRSTLELRLSAYGHRTPRTSFTTLHAPTTLRRFHRDRPVPAPHALALQITRCTASTQ